jgi:hypothetical protein
MPYIISTKHLLSVFSLALPNSIGQGKAVPGFGRASIERDEFVSARYSGGLPASLAILSVATQIFTKQ